MATRQHSEGWLARPVICPIMIGREAALAALADTLDHADEQHNRALLVAGEAGIGKTRLCAAVRAEAASRGLNLAQGNCFESDRSLPYAPFLDLLASVLATLDPSDIPAYLGASTDVLLSIMPAYQHLASPQPDLPPEQAKQRTFHAFARYLARQPVLITIEDLHWCDDTSLELLEFLLRRPLGQAATFLLTYRSDEIHPALNHLLAMLDRMRLSTEVRLDRLDSTGIEAMLRAIFHLDHHVQAELLHVLYGLTDGNPFFLEEMLRAMINDGDLNPLNLHWQGAEMVGVPRSIHDVVRRRLDQLSDDARRAVTIAAVAGRRFDFAILHAAVNCEEGELLDCVKALVAAQLVVEDAPDQFSFRHALTREAIISGMLARERQRIHRVLAETMETMPESTRDRYLADLATHCFASGMWVQAFDYSRRLGETAEHLYAPRAAIDHFTRAIAAARHLDKIPPIAVLRGRARAHDLLGEFDQALADYTMVCELARQSGDQPQEWQALVDLGMLWAGRDYAQTGKFYKEANALARTMNDPAILARSLNFLGNWHVNAERPHEAHDRHQEALAIFQTLGDRRGIAETLDIMGMSCYLMGDMVAGRAAYDEAAALLRVIGDRQRLVSAMTLVGLSVASYECDGMVTYPLSDEVISTIEEALALAGVIGYRSGEAFACYTLGVTLGPHGAFDQAREILLHGRAIAEEIAHRQWITAIDCGLGMLALDFMDIPQARAYFTDGLALAREIQSGHWMHTLAGSLILACVAQGDLAQAADLLSEFLTTDDTEITLGWRRIERGRAEYALATGHPEDALRIAERMIIISPNITADEIVYRFTWLRGQSLMALRRFDEAEMAFHACLNHAQTHEMRSTVWRIFMALGKLAQAQHRAAEAELAFAQARAEIEHLATTIADEASRANFTREALAQLPPTRSATPRQIAKAHAGGLTGREREVAMLIARGRSNREIAQELVLGERTVETHTSNILAKLGFTSRAQIAAWAVEKGLLA